MAIFAGLIGAALGGGDILAGLFGGAEAATALGFGGAEAAGAFGGAEALGVGARGGAALDTGAAASSLELGSLLAGGAAPTVAGVDLTGMAGLDLGLGTAGAGAFTAPTVAGEFAALGAPAAAAVASPLPLGFELAAPAAAGGIDLGSAAVTDVGGNLINLGTSGGLTAAGSAPSATGLDAISSAMGLSSAGPASTAGTSALSMSPAGTLSTGIPDLGGLAGGAGPTGGQYVAATGIPGTSGPTVAGTSTGGTSFLDTILGGAKTLAGGTSPLTLGLGAAGLGYNIYTGQKAQASQQALMDQAAQEKAAANQMQSYLSTGTLPAGLQTGVDKATAAAKAAAIQRAANAGMPTDPSQNSALATDLQNIDIQQQVTTAQLGEELFKVGSSGLSLSSQDLQALMGLEQKQSEAVGTALSNFAAATQGGIKTAGTGKSGGFMITPTG